MFFFKKKKNTASVAATTVAKKGRQPSLPTTRLLTDRMLTRAIVEKTPVNAHDVSVPPLSSPAFSIDRPLPPLPSQSLSSRESSSSMMSSNLSDIATPQQEEFRIIPDGHEKEGEVDWENEQGGLDAPGPRTAPAVPVAAVIEGTEHAEEDMMVRNKASAIEYQTVVAATDPMEEGVKSDDKEVFVRVEPVTATAAAPLLLLRLKTAEQTAVIKQSHQVPPNIHSKGSSITSNITSGIPRRRQSPGATTIAASAKDPLTNKKLGRFSPTGNSLLPIPKSQAHQKKQIPSETSRQCRTGQTYSTRLPVRRTT